MEKYGKWRDKETGVGPFLPRKKKEHLIFTILRWLFGLIKLPIFTLSMLVSWVNITFAYYIPIRFIGRLWDRIHSFFSYYLYLALFGQWWTKVELTPLIRKIVKEKWAKPGHGDIIFAQLSSYINLLWLQKTFSPIFVVPTSDNMCVVRSCPVFIMHILFHKDLRKGKQESIEEVIKNARNKKRGPVVIFPECATTNGEGILEFQSFQCEVPKDTNVQVIGFKRDCRGKDVFYKGQGPNFTAGSGVAHLIRNLGRFVCHVEVEVSLKADVRSPDGRIDKDYIDHVRDVMSRMTRLPTVALNAQDFQDFLEFYNERNKAKRGKKLASYDEEEKDAKKKK